MNVDGLLLNLAASVAAVVVVLGVTFVVTVVRRRHDTIDTAWGLGFVVIAAVSVVVSAGDARAWLVLTLTAVWGGRLAIHLHDRNTQRGEDPRYTGTRLWAVYLAQGAIMLLVSLPLQAAAHLRADIGVLDALAVLVWLTGFVFESVADAQLVRFTGDPANTGRVLDTGLWRYSRHPNYFGDACVWWGLFLFAAHHWIGLLTVVSPLVMTAVLARGTGKPMTERRMMSSRPGYAGYARTTSGFVPMPPKRH